MLIEFRASYYRQYLNIITQCTSIVIKSIHSLLFVNEVAIERSCKETLLYVISITNKSACIFVTVYQVNLNSPQDMFTYACQCVSSLPANWRTCTWRPSSFGMQRLAIIKPAPGKYKRAACRTKMRRLAASKQVAGGFKTGGWRVLQSEGPAKCRRTYMSYPAWKS